MKKRDAYLTLPAMVVPDVSEFCRRNTPFSAIQRSILFVFLVFLSANRLQAQIDIKPSMITEDHTAEGFMVTLPDGSIRHFFRLDPGFAGHHVGQDARIVQRTSYDQGVNWTQPVKIYEDEWDNRNVHGGLTREGRIVLFFRNFRPANKKTIATNFMYSDDYGITWSPVQQLSNELADNPGTHKMIHIPGIGYMQSFYQPFVVQLRFSNDGSNWDSTGQVWDYRKDQSKKITEACFAYAGNGRLVGLFRDENRLNFFQVSSADYGKTWTEPIRTNIGGGKFFTPSPQIFYDDYTNKLVVLTNDRRGLNGDVNTMIDAQFYIYLNDPDSAIGNPMSYQRVYEVERPNRNVHHFYGYPTQTKLSKGRYLVVFTEAYLKENRREQADFYQFFFETKHFLTPAEQLILAKRDRKDARKAKFRKPFSSRKSQA